MAKYRFLKSVSTPSGFNVSAGNVLTGTRTKKLNPKKGYVYGVSFYKNGASIFIPNNKLDKFVRIVPTDIGVGTPKPVAKKINVPTVGGSSSPINSPFDGERVFFDNDTMSYFDDEDSYFDDEDSDFDGDDMSCFDDEY
jgi:hypothetical protein